jgi:hypothetical protein
MEPPIACSLTAEELRGRTEHLAALAARSLTARETTADGVRLTFADIGDTGDELRAAIAAEAECCPFLAMTLQRRDGALVLDVAGPEDARPVMAALFARC